MTGKLLPLADDWPWLAATVAKIADACPPRPARRQRILRAVAQDWRFVTTLDGAPGDEATPYEKRLTLESLARIFRDGAATDPALAEQAAVLEALLWHYRRPFGPVWLAETTRALRAQAARAAHPRQAAA